jgi:hypothetical protein
MQITYTKPIDNSASFFNHDDPKYVEFLSAFQSASRESSTTTTTDSGMDTIVTTIEVSPENIDAFNKVLADFKSVRIEEMDRRKLVGITVTIVADPEILYSLH